MTLLLLTKNHKWSKSLNTDIRKLATGLAISLGGSVFSSAGQAESLSLSLKPCSSSETVNVIELDSEMYICALPARANYLSSPENFVIHSYGDNCPNGFQKIPQLTLITERTFSACKPHNKEAFEEFFGVAHALPIVHWFRGFKCDYGVVELSLEASSESSSAVGCVVN